MTFEELKGDDDRDHGCDGGGGGCVCRCGGVWQWNVTALSKLDGIINFRPKPRTPDPSLCPRGRRFLLSSPKLV